MAVKNMEGSCVVLNMRVCTVSVSQECPTCTCKDSFVNLKTFLENATLTMICQCVENCVQIWKEQLAFML